jgi:F-type H+-transporting ATPase subunit delta
MAELSTIARPYARAAFESATKLQSLAEWSETLARAAEVVTDARVRALIGNPRVALAELTELIFELATGAGAGKGQSARSHKGQRSRSHQELHNLFQLLTANRRLSLLPEIAAQFEALRADAEQFASVEVRSARELTREQAQRLQSALERRLGRTVRLSTHVDPSLIGGAVVQYGDFVLDGSLRRSLERMGSVIGA